MVAQTNQPPQNQTLLGKIQKQFLVLFAPLSKRFSTLRVYGYRLSGGRIGRAVIDGAEVCLLTVKGRRTGESRTVPLVCVTNGDDLILVGSYSGLDQHPDWYYNLMASTNVTIRRGVVDTLMTTSVADGEPRQALWQRVNQVFPHFGLYQKRTLRVFPLIVCTPVTNKTT